MIEKEESSNRSYHQYAFFRKEQIRMLIFKSRESSSSDDGLPKRNSGGLPGHHRHGGGSEQSLDDEYDMCSDVDDLQDRYELVDEVSDLRRDPRGKPDRRPRPRRGEEGFPDIDSYDVFNDGSCHHGPSLVDEEERTAVFRGRRSSGPSYVAASGHIDGSMDETESVTFSRHRGTRSYVRCGLETRQPDFDNGDFGPQLHGGRHRYDVGGREPIKPHQAGSRLEKIFEDDDDAGADDEFHESQRRHERRERLGARPVHSANCLATDGGRGEDLEDKLREGRYRNGHDLGVGPGVELPTRMHYYEDEIIDHELAHETPGISLRRVPVVHFGSLQVRETLANRFSNDVFFNSELEERPPYRTHQFNPRHLRQERTPQQPFHSDDHRTTGRFEGGHGQAAFFPDDTITSKQFAAHLQSGLPNEKTPQQVGTTLPNQPPDVQAQGIESAKPQQGGRTLGSHGLDGIVEEAPRGWAASPERTP